MRRRPMEAGRLGGVAHEADSDGAAASAEAEPPPLDDNARIGSYGIDAERAVVRLAFAAFGAGVVMLIAAIAHAPG